MALSNYSELKQSIIAWSFRNDMDLLIDDFILLAETEMFNNSFTNLEVKGQETTDTTLTTTARIVALPTNYQSMRSIRLSLNSFGSEIRFRAPEQMIRSDTTGRPVYFTIVGNNIEFDREPDALYEIEIKYYASPTALSSTNATNTVLTNNPTIYLFGSLWALYTHAVDEVEAQKYYTRFIGAIKGANKQSKSGRYGPAPAMRIEGSTP